MEDIKTGANALRAFDIGRMTDRLLDRIEDSAVTGADDSGSAYSIPTGDLRLHNDTESKVVPFRRLGSLPKL